MEVRPANCYRGVDLDQFPLRSDFDVPQLDKMYQAFLKAVIEHGQEKLLSSLDLGFKRENYALLSPKIYEYAEQGKRAAMEDAHYGKRLKNGRALSAGIFDGHAEKGEIAQKAANAFRYYLEAQIDKRKGNVEVAFSDKIDEIHKQVTKNGEIQVQQGSTALVVYLDLTTNLLYTCTLGDSWARIYRKQENDILAIPLSQKKNLASEEVVNHLIDIYRAKGTEEGLKLAAKVAEWPKALNPKKLRLPGGLNCSHAIGDGWYGDQVSQTPTVTVIQVHQDDLLIEACDGVWDFISDEQEFIDQVIRPNWEKEKLPKKIGKYALKQQLKQKSYDNVSIVTVLMHPSENGELSDYESSYESTELLERSDSDLEGTQEDFAEDNSNDFLEIEREGEELIKIDVEEEELNGAMEEKESTVKKGFDRSS